MVQINSSGRWCNATRPRVSTKSNALISIVDDDAAVRPVDDGGAARGRALLAEGVAVAGGHIGVGAPVGPVRQPDSPGQVQ